MVELTVGILLFFFFFSKIPFCKSSEEVTTSPVTTTEYWNAAPHPQLAHLPQLPHPLNNTKVVTATVPTTTIKKLPTTQTKIGMLHWEIIRTILTRLNLHQIDCSLILLIVCYWSCCSFFFSFWNFFVFVLSLQFCSFFSHHPYAIFLHAIFLFFK